MVHELWEPMGVVPDPPGALRAPAEAVPSDKLEAPNVLPGDTGALSFPCGHNSVPASSAPSFP